MRFSFLVGAMLLLAQSGAMAGEGEEPVSFNSPSGNISCHYTPKGELPRQSGGLHCARFLPTPVRLFLGEKGKATVQTGIKDACCKNSPVLAYEETWRGGPFTCYSEMAGMRCENKPGNGFFVSRRHFDTY